MVLEMAVELSVWLGTRTQLPIHEKIQMADQFSLEPLETWAEVCSFDFLFLMWIELAASSWSRSSKMICEC